MRHDGRAAGWHLDAEAPAVRFGIYGRNKRRVLTIILLLLLVASAIVTILLTAI